MSESDAAKHPAWGATSTEGARLASGVPNLDQILGGGLVSGSLVLIVGAPGSGKTTIASQIALHAAASKRS